VQKILFQELHFQATDHRGSIPYSAESDSRNFFDLGAKPKHNWSKPVVPHGQGSHQLLLSLQIGQPPPLLPSHFKTPLIAQLSIQSQGQGPSILSTGASENSQVIQFNNGSKLIC
jgi:hypothetical protein